MLRLALLAPFATLVVADFIYDDFTDASGVQFNGDAGISACGDSAGYNFFKLAGINDAPDMGDDGAVYSEDTGDLRALLRDTEQRSAADAASVIGDNQRFIAAFPTRGNFTGAPGEPCAPRLRLTPSRPSRAGSAFRREAVTLLNGFDTRFTFQISDHSRACTQVRDRLLTLRTYQVCTTHGGDGFAFVIQLGDDFSAALGAAASGLGYAGLTNAIAVEFDTWYNPERDYEDLMQDHIAVYASPRGGGSISSDAFTRISKVHAADIADGQLHTVRVTYYPYIKYDLMPWFETTSFTTAFMLDAGENRRIGTLAVYYDNMTAPILAVPMNLNVALTLPEDQAFVGFTASTGSSWEKHDIIDWYFCESTTCDVLRGDTARLKYRPV